MATEDVVFFWVFGAFVFSYILHKVMSRSWGRRSTYDQEICDILNKEEHRVKGRFD
ncbi:MAG: hypothetical protein AABX39_00705 [Nanoarchaeota archaeon]